MDIDNILTNLVDLHTHLSTSTTPHLLWELAHSQGIRLPEKDYWKFIELVRIDKKSTVDEYHKFFDLIQIIQSSPFAVEQSTYNAMSLSYRKSNINIQELRMNPLRRNKEGLYDVDRIIFGALIGIKRAQMEYPVVGGMILEADTRFEKFQNEIIIEKAIKYSNDGVIGIDVSGPYQENFNLKDLQEPYKEAKKQGLGLTVHAGETSSAKEVWEALEVLNPDRIGHGIKSVEDKELLKELSKRGVVLEVCPTSNYLIQAVSSWDEFKSVIKTLKQYNVKFTINADNPVLLTTNAKQEFKKLYEKKIMGLEDIKEAIEVSKTATFIKQA
ncbi:MAG TPA: adenosine deaminase [Candidatus Dojkabacteria bacterium]|jgi:adenosine deaminase